MALQAHQRASAVRCEASRTSLIFCRRTPAIVKCRAHTGGSTSHSEMQITRQNFQESLPRVRSLIDAASFISFDCEMTGLFVENSMRDHRLDSYSERYRKLLVSAQSFTICQFGLSCWNWRGTAWEASTLNFYLFPFTADAQDSRFLCQASSLQFLASHGFDFNKFIYDGIPHMSLQLRDRKLQALQQTLGSSRTGPTIPTAAHTASALEQPITSDTRTTPIHPVDQEDPSSSTNSKLSSFATTNSHLQAQIHSAAGFAAVWEMMLTSGKPLVAHNPCFDLAYSLQLFQSQLPDSWPAYKVLLNQILSRHGTRLFDTKHLASQLGDRALSSNTGLGPLYTALCATKLPPTASGIMPAALHAPGYTDYSQITTEQDIIATLTYSENPSSHSPQHMIQSTPGTQEGVVAYSLHDSLHDSLHIQSEDGNTAAGDALSPAVLVPGSALGAGKAAGSRAHEAGYDAFMTGAIFVKLLALFEAKATGSTASLQSPASGDILPQLHPQLASTLVQPQGASASPAPPAAASVHLANTQSTPTSIPSFPTSLPSGSSSEQTQTDAAVADHSSAALGVTLSEVHPSAQSGSPQDPGHQPDATPISHITHLSTPTETSAVPSPTSTAPTAGVLTPLIPAQTSLPSVTTNTSVTPDTHGPNHTPTAQTSPTSPTSHMDPLSTSIRYISAHQQRIYMGNSDLPHWEFGQAPDPTVARPNVFYVPNLRPGMRAQEVMARFASANLGRVSVKMLPAQGGGNYQGALVELLQPPPSLAWVVHSVQGFKLMTYADYFAAENLSSKSNNPGQSNPNSGTTNSKATRAPPKQLLSSSTPSPTSASKPPITLKPVSPLRASQKNTSTSASAQLPASRNATTTIPPLFSTPKTTDPFPPVVSAASSSSTIARAGNLLQESDGGNEEAASQRNAITAAESNQTPSITPTLQSGSGSVLNGSDTSSIVQQGKEFNSTPMEDIISGEAQPGQVEQSASTAVLIQDSNLIGNRDVKKSGALAVASESATPSPAVSADTQDTAAAAAAVGRQEAAAAALAKLSGSATKSVTDAPALMGRPSRR